MNRSRGVTAAALILLMAAGWGASAAGIGGRSPVQRSREYSAAIQKAEDYADRGLYQLAIREYATAESDRADEDVYTAMLAAYDKLYAEDEDDSVLSEETQAAQRAVNAYPKNTDFLEKLVGLLTEDENYYRAEKVIETAISKGINEDDIHQLHLRVRYGFSTGWSSYNEVRPYCSNYYAVRTNNRWSYIDADGDTSGKGLLEAYSVGEDGRRLEVTSFSGDADSSGTGSTEYASVGADAGSTEYASAAESTEYAALEEEGVSGYQRTILIDGDSVIQGIFHLTPEAAGIYSGGFIAVKTDGTYSYYTSVGDRAFGGYVSAGAFASGLAPVRESQDSKVMFIDDTGKNSGIGEYEDIAMDQNGIWCLDGHMLANPGGGYRLYEYKDSDHIFEETADLKAEDVDILTSDEKIAFERDGKWGFCDTDGKTLIEPQYDGAKSFSGGLAAVRVNGKWGFINEDNEIVIEPQFLNCDYFNGSRSCMVQTAANTWQLITLYLDS